MLVTAIVLSIAEVVLFREIYCGGLTIILTLIGWTLRKSAMKLGANYSRYSRRFLFLYGLGFFVADRAGCGVQMKLVVIAFACIVMFNLNFWSITEEAMANQQHH